MPTTRAGWIALTAVVAVLGAVWIAMTRVSDGPAALAATTAAEVGSLAPDFTLTTLDGEDLTLSDLRGRPVVVNFWATWCPPCRAEIPALDQAGRELGGDVVILGVDVQEDPAAVAAFAAEIGMRYPVALDETAAVARAYRVRAFPTTYFIDSRGVVVDVISGPLNVPLLYTRLAELEGVR